MIAVIKAIILNCIRDRKNLFFMILFPLFLIFIVGGTLSSYFDSMNKSVFVGDFNIYYLNEGDEKINEVFDTFKNVVEESKDIEDISIKKIDNIDEGKKEVRVNRAVLLHLKGDTIEVYSNDESFIKNSLVYGILESITDRYNAVTEVYEINPMKAGEIINSNEDTSFIKSDDIPYEKTPNSMDYYGVAEIGLMMFYFISYPLYFLKEDKLNNIKDRIKLSGLSLNKYYLSSFIGFFIFSYCVALINYILSNILFDINYGDNLLIMPLAMIPFLIIVNGIGVLIEIILKDDKVANTLVQNIIIPALTFLGGGYIAIYGEIDGLFNLITEISPLRWFNRSIFRSIYSNDNSLLVNWMIFGIVVLVILIILIFFISKREESNNEKYISVN
ncbi:ABC transporter permease [Clostridium tertium]|uniref:ABC-2 family transporter protein n=1 Tax=Clostridium tertium TaxID=1559 RepID=A0A6N3AD46_9CLOT